MPTSPLSQAASPPHLLDRLRAGHLDGRSYASLRSKEVDKMLIDLASAQFTAGSGITIFAVGGYGRAELCPYSDIDILFLTDAPDRPDQAAIVERYLYAVWDLGLKTSHAVRTIDECRDIAARDSKVMTSLLDARLLYGEPSAGRMLHEKIVRLLPEAGKRDFIDSKLSERDARHRRYGDTRYALEPNIKEGKGGLRDFQTMLWIADMLYGARSAADLAAQGILTDSEAARYDRCHAYLLTVRCHLHDLAGRAEDRLHFDIQPDLAERLGYRDRTTGRAVERFMKHYFLMTRKIGDFTRIVIAAIQHEAANDGGAYLGYDILDGRLMFSAGRGPHQNPLEMLRIFKVFQDSGKDIHPVALKEIARSTRFIDNGLRNNQQANRIFVDILTSPNNAAATLRRLNEAGVLGRFVPDFGRIVAMMQFDRYHYFTVDEHILRCIDIAHALREGALTSEAPLASEAMRDIADMESLCVALFLHDIAKGRGGRHAELGAEIALSLCPRFGLDPEQTDLVSWLIHEHLLMSNTAFRRNLNDPKTIADFSARIRSPERLAMLFCLTTADIMAVGPGRWTAWKARLLEELFLKTLTLMQGDEPGVTIEAKLPPDYREGETHITITTDENQSATIVHVYTPDRPGLFALLCGALSAEGTSIMRAYIDTVAERRIAADRFVIQNGSGLPLIQRHRQDAVRQAITAALDGTLDIDGRVEAHRRPMTRQDEVFNFPPTISINNDASGTDTVIEIEARDRHGLLYDVACMLRDQGYDMRAAKINTQGLRAIDSFYIQTAKRRKLTDAKAQARLVDGLKAIVAKP